MHAQHVFGNTQRILWTADLRLMSVLFYLFSYNEQSTLSFALKQQKKVIGKSNLGTPTSLEVVGRSQYHDRELQYQSCKIFKR
jgi:hypothetical protein